jgi:hypothetical protein
VAVTRRPAFVPTPDRRTDVYGAVVRSAVDVGWPSLGSGRGLDRTEDVVRRAGPWRSLPWTAV